MSAQIHGVGPDTVNTAADRFRGISRWYTQFTTVNPMQATASAPPTALPATNAPTYAPHRSAGEYGQCDGGCRNTETAGVARNAHATGDARNDANCHETALSALPYYHCDVSSRDATLANTMKWVK